MTLQAIKDEIGTLPQRQRRELVTYLVSLEDKARRARAKRMAEKINDNDPSYWLALEDVEDRLGINDIP